MKLWFMGGAEVDADIVRRFGADCQALIEGQYDGWAAQGTPQATLAAIVIGDQLCRNAFRGTAKMYAADPRVLGWAKGLLASGGDAQLLPIQRPFVYLPLMHSEVLEDQEECIARYEKLAAECEARGLADVGKLAKEGTQYAKAHRDVVARWGRFPHRNAILGRDNTPDEAEGIAAGTIPKW
ncbi:hypothetical protein C2E20_8870 [Micractinium conductrix]|uniref:Uncharacterized protein n=1 Tax=Micractinium conductrix TaxID=554055 RepID=A0A2P6V035_9CHLO|nr:hypothetical protein C2E20_8870 [Micractinium conductrix]|eukprot:PSC67458.1 hypothetical protein C2E20_8870 [Micractinium conductrix]